MGKTLNSHSIIVLRMMIRPLTLLLIAAFITVLVPASGAGPFTAQNASAVTVPTWTFMVYLDADNSLSKYAADNLASMMSYGSNEHLHIVVLYDSIDDGDSALYYIEKGKKTLIKSLGEVDMGSEKTLQFFLNWTASNYPAQHYFLDLWDHGSYYHGVCMDHGDWLTLNELDTALSFFDNKIGHKMDIVGFDACRMGGIEIYYALAPYVDYAVASEKDEPASGWPYYDVLKGIYGKEPWDAAKSTADAMYDWAKKFYASSGLSVTMAAVNLTEFPDFINSFNDALQQAMPVVPYYSEHILTAFRNAERYELTSVADLYNLMELIDSIGDYKLDHLANVTKVWINRIVYSRVWDCPNPANGVHAGNAHGMGIYAPMYFVSGDYYYTEFAKNTLWPKFLNYVLNPPPVNGTGSAKINMNSDYLDVNYTTSADYVEIYVENSTVSGSGLLPPAGNYSINLNYGVYTVFIYAYNNSGMVVWAERKTVDFLKTVLLKGKFYLNGHVLSGARIRVTVENYTFITVQNRTGFQVAMKYPKEINSDSVVNITVSYGFMQWHYRYHPEGMRGNTTLPVNIYASLIPSPYISAAIVLLTTLLAALLLRKKSVKISEEENPPS